MAGDWIKMRVDLKDDPAVFMLADMLGVDEFSVVGRLHCFWVWADKHAVDGRVDGATTRIVDRVSATDGFAASMQKVGWLVVDESGISIPNFDRHNGESAKERGLKNARQARWRAGKADVVDAQPSTKRSTKRSTREEKRREEKTLSADADGSPAGFDAFWSVWPASDRKVAKKQCATKWKAHNFNSQLPAILAHIEAMKQSKQWRTGYEPAPLTYLNQERWRDGLPSDADAHSEAGFI
jgi:hypothetical protein